MPAGVWRTSAVSALAMDLYGELTSPVVSAQHQTDRLYTTQSRINDSHQTSVGNKGMCLQLEAKPNNVVESLFTGKMFWKFNLLPTSRIDSLLEKEEITLHELMDEDDILQECKTQNKKLVDFLVRPENMEELIRLITQDPDSEVEEKAKYKYPNTACELLTSDVSQINDALAASDDLVNNLYKFLELEKPLNPLLASFFSKVMGLLITRKSEMIFEYLKAKEDFVGTLLYHIGTSAIMDLLLRLLTCVESPEVRKAVIEWLNEQQIVEKLVGCLIPSKDEDIHCNAAQSLCDIVRLGREQLSQLQDGTDPDPLLNTVELEKTITELLNGMLNCEKNESVIVNGLSVIQTLLEFRKQGPDGSTEHIPVDTDGLAQGVNNVLLAITPRLKDLHNLLLNPPRYNAMPTTVGTLDPPLGNTRLQITRLLSALLLTNTHTINVELANLGTTGILLDLYFQYVWNNFLHTNVVQYINTILGNSCIEVEGAKEHPLLSQLFTECRVLQRLVEKWEETEPETDGITAKRKGYMGHSTRMANDIVTVLEKGENASFIQDQINENPEDVRQKWETFVAESLAEINKRNTVELVRGHPLASSSEDDDAEFRDIPFPQDTAMQQAFSDYQLQQMTSNFIDTFGFNEEEFAEQEEKIDSPFNERISSIDFNIRTEESHQPASSMFEQVCNERIQQFDDDSDEDIWEEKEITFSQNVPRLDETRSDDSDSISTDSSDEDLDSRPRINSLPMGEKMDVDNNEGTAWTAQFDEAMDAAPVAMDSASWENINNESGTTQPSTAIKAEESWADFTNKIPSRDGDNWADFSNFHSSTTAGPRSSSPVAMDTTDVNARSNLYVSQGAVKDNGNVASIEIEDLESKPGDVNVEVSIIQGEGGAMGSVEVKHNSSVSEEEEKDQNSTSKNSVEDAVSASPKVSEEESRPAAETASSGSIDEPKPADIPVPQSSPPNTQDAENFLSATGLLKSSPVPTSNSLEESAGSAETVAVPEPALETSSQENGGIVTEQDIETATSISKIEEARAQAKEAMEKLDNKVLASASLQNGPV
ncbi:hypothetical protein ScPMuIL_012758 [Solemya velum]